MVLPGRGHRGAADDDPRFDLRFYRGKAKSGEALSSEIDDDTDCRPPVGDGRPPTRSASPMSGADREKALSAIGTVAGEPSLW